MRKLSRREAVLAGLVGAAVFLVFNLIVLKALVGRQSALRRQITGREAELQSMKVLLAERDLWARREAWLNEKQPKLTNENSAGVQLLQQINDLAKKQSVTVENPAFAAPAKTPWYRSVSVNVETKSGWAGLIHFLQELQQPEQFVVVETANVAIDSSDATQMRGKFRVARWYAP